MPSRAGRRRFARHRRLLFQRRRPAAVRDLAAARRRRLPLVKTVEITSTDGVLLAGVVIDGRLTDLAAERLSRPSLAGAVVLARVEKVDRVSAAAFLDIGTGRSAFLPLRGPDAELASRRRAGDRPDRRRPQGREGGGGDPRRGAARRRPDPSAVLDEVAVSSRLGPAAKREWQQRLEGGWIVRAASAGMAVDAALDEATRLARRWEAIADRAEATRAPALLGRRRAPPAGCPGSSRRCPHRHRRRRPAAAAAPLGHETAVPDLAPRIAAGAAPLGDAAGHAAGPDRAAALRRQHHHRGDPRSDRDRRRWRPRAATLSAPTARRRCEIARQLRLRNIGGIVVVDFISLRRGGDRAALF